MALAGLKKQFNKANQFMSEKIGGVEGTKFTDDFTQLERKTDMTNELVDELINKTKEYLQPNPASRTKLMVSSKLKGAPGKPHTYPQPEGVLGEIMCKYGKELGDDSNFARSLNEMGEAMKELAEVKYSLEDNVKQNFLEPLTHLQAKDLKDVMFHRKKLEGRRLDYDCKKRKATKGTHFGDEEIRMAEGKFEESFNLASMGMHNLLQNEIEQLSQICVLSEALYEYHSQCANVLESLNARLMEIKNEAAQRTFQPYVPKKLHELNLITPSVGHPDDLSPGDHNMNGSRHLPATSLHTNSHYSSSQSLSSSSSSFRAQNPSSHPKSVYPSLAGKSASNPSASSSPSWSTKSSSRQTNGHLNGVSSTTAYLLSGKANHGSSGSSSVPKSQFASPFSKSVSNLNSSASFPSFDLLGSIESDETNLYETSSTSRYQSSGYSSNSSSLQNNHNNNYRHSAYYDYNASRTPTERGPCAQALYDFDAENENELCFKEGDLIQLVSQIDDNWYEGQVNGRTGLFPVSYVQVLVPVPKQ